MVPTLLKWMIWGVKPLFLETPRYYPPKTTYYLKVSCVLGEQQADASYHVGCNNAETFKTWAMFEAPVRFVLYRGLYYLVIWVFQKIGVPKNGWFIMESHIKIHDLGVGTYFWKYPYNIGIIISLYNTSLLTNQDSMECQPRFLNAAANLRVLP